MDWQIVKNRISVMLETLLSYPDDDDIFGPDSHYVNLFNEWNHLRSEMEKNDPELSYLPGYIKPFLQRGYRKGKDSQFYTPNSYKELLYALKQALAAVISKLSEKPTPSVPEPSFGLQQIANRFFYFARQICVPYRDRQIIEIKDEYDVQILFHSLLKLFYDDIRPEDYVPENGGKKSRIDFFIPAIETIIEVKMIRPSLLDAQLGEELIIDKERYKKYPGARILYCFVYNPDLLLRNPQGLMTDLSEDGKDLRVIVKILPM